MVVGEADRAVARAPVPPRAGAGRVVDVAERAIEAAAATLLVATAVIALVQVFFRYVLNASLPWPEELARWAFVWLVFTGMAIGVRRGTHIRIDVLAARLPPRARAVHAVLVAAVVAGACVALLVHGLDLVGRSSNVSPALGWPFTFLYLAVPAGSAISLAFLATAPPPGAASRWAGPAAIVLGAALYLLVRHALAGPVAAFGTAETLMAIGLGLVFLGVPVAFALVAGVFTAFAAKPEVILVTVSQNMTSALDSFILLAIPFFILAAAAMNAGGITERLVTLATRLVGHLRGGLGHVNVLTNTMMAGVSGSSMADAAAIAKIMVPSMAARGYPRAFSCALTSASSVLANLIPPSLALIIYGSLASVSVGALFVAAIVPGLLVAAALALVVALVARRADYGAGTARSSGRERAGAFLLAVPALVLPVLIVGGVRYGAFTATEAGAIAFLYAVLCGTLVYRRLTPSRFVQAVREALADTLAVMVIIAAAAPFAWVLASERVPQDVAALLGEAATDPLTLLILLNVFLLVVGLFMEMIAAMVILVPIFVPLVIAAGVDPVHFGIVIVMNLVIGALTPPLGMLVFTTARVGGVEPVAVFRAMLPFLAALLGVLLLVTFVPAISLALTRVLGP